MTNKQRMFCSEYMIDLNATQAAIRAGYSPASARQIAELNMTKHYIKAYIDKLLADQSARTGITADRVLRELAKIAFVDISDAADMDEATINKLASKDDTAAIASVRAKKIPTADGFITEREIKLYDKTKALELLGNHLRMFTDVSQVELSGDTTIKVNLVDDSDK